MCSSSTGESLKRLTLTSLISQEQRLSPHQVVTHNVNVPTVNIYIDSVSCVIYIEHSVWQDTLLRSNVHTILNVLYTGLSMYLH